MIDEQTKAKIFQADLSNIVKKVKAGKPLNKAERDLVSSNTEKGKLGTAKNIAAACALTGLSDMLIRLARDRGCQAIRPNGNIQCDELIDFIAANPELRKFAEAIPDYKLEKALDLRESRLLKEQRRLKLGGQLVALDALRRDWTQMIISAKTKLNRAANEIAVEAGMRLGLPSDTSTAIREIVTKRHLLIVRELHSGEYGDAECSKCGEKL